MTAEGGHRNNPKRFLIARWKKGSDDSSPDLLRHDNGEARSFSTVPEAMAAMPATLHWVYEDDGELDVMCAEDDEFEYAIMAARKAVRH